LIELLKSKLHNVYITETQKEYEGSITIDLYFMEQAELSPYQKVLVADVENGARFETYVIPGPHGSGIIGVNGSAANLVEEGHRVIVMAFTQIEDDINKILDHEVIKVIFDQNKEKNNKIKDSIVEKVAGACEHLKEDRDEKRKKVSSAEF